MQESLDHSWMPGHLGAGGSTQTVSEHRTTPSIQKRRVPLQQHGGPGDHRTERRGKDAPRGSIYTRHLKYRTDAQICGTATASWHRLVIDTGRGVQEGRTGRLGLADADGDIQDGETARSYCVAQGAVVSSR